MKGLHKKVNQINSKEVSSVFELLTLMKMLDILNRFNLIQHCSPKSLAVDENSIYGICYGNKKFAMA